MVPEKVRKRVSETNSDGNFRANIYFIIIIQESFIKQAGVLPSRPLVIQRVCSMHTERPYRRSPQSVVSGEAVQDLQASSW